MRRLNPLGFASSRLGASLYLSYRSCNDCNAVSSRLNALAAPVRHQSRSLRRPKERLNLVRKNPADCNAFAHSVQLPRPAFRIGINQPSNRRDRLFWLLIERIRLALNVPGGNPREHRLHPGLRRGRSNAMTMCRTLNDPRGFANDSKDCADLSNCSGSSHPRLLHIKGLISERLTGPLQRRRPSSAEITVDDIVLRMESSAECDPHRCGLRKQPPPSQNAIAALNTPQPSQPSNFVSQPVSAAAQPARAHRGRLNTRRSRQLRTQRNLQHVAACNNERLEAATASDRRPGTPPHQSTIVLITGGFSVASQRADHIPNRAEQQNERVSQTRPARSLRTTSPRCSTRPQRPVRTPPGPRR